MFATPAARANASADLRTWNCLRHASTSASFIGTDPMATTLRQRELAKAEELRSAGHQVALRTFHRMRRNYQTGGLWGLVDGRLARPSSPTGKTDERVVDGVRQAVREQADASTGTVDRVRRRAEQILAEAGVDPASVMPSRAGFYRLLKSLSEGRQTFGSAPTRRSLAKQPDGPFGTVTAFRSASGCRSTPPPLNIAVRLDNGLTEATSRSRCRWTTTSNCCGSTGGEQLLRDQIPDTTARSRDKLARDQ